MTPVPGRLDGTPTSTIEAVVSVSIPDPAIRGGMTRCLLFGSRTGACQRIEE